jgi:hypothetical protein
MLNDEAIDVITRRLREKHLLLDFDLKTINVINYFKKQRRIKKHMAEIAELLDSMSRINGESGGTLRVLDSVLEFDEELTASRELTEEEQYIKSEFACDYERQIKDYIENELKKFNFEEE